MCTRHLARFRAEDMSLDLFRHLVEEHPDVEAIWPYGFGEPLLHPQIFDFISFAKRLGKTVCLSTNATLLTADRSNSLLDSGLDYLILAVDGGESTSYSANRYPASLADTERRIDGFLAQKLARISKVHVTVQMVLLKNNAREVHAFRRRWRRPGVDTVRVRNDLSGLPGISLQDRRVRSPAKRPCFFLWRGPIFVQAAGTLLPCPYYHGSHPFGDLRFQNGLEAWNSKEMQALRMAHSRRDLSRYPVCLRCPRHQPHPILAALSFFVNTHNIRRLLPWIERLQARLKVTLFE
jgi:MoaA/NifB/PqqE/SkfB family radical SAM enzyme